VDGASRLETGWWALAIPLVIVEIGEVIVHATDTLLLARVGMAELGAVALGDTVLELALVPAFGLVEAVQIMVARRAGQEREVELWRTFVTGMALVGAVSVVVTGVVSILAPGLAGRLAPAPAVESQLAVFLRVAAVGTIFEALSLTMGALCVGLGRLRVLIGATVGLVVSNLLLGGVLIFGPFGLPALGMRGAALGSVAAEVVAFCILASYILRHLRPASHPWQMGDGRLARSLVRLAGPVSIQESLDAGRWLLFFLLVGRLGEEALAAASLVFACYAVFSIPVAGCAEAVCTVVSRLVGRQETGGISAAVHQLSRRAYLVTLPLLAVGVVGPAALLTVFATEGGDPQGAAAAVRVVALAMVVIIPGELWLAALAGTGDTDRALLAEMGQSVVMIGGAWLAVTVGAGVTGAWAAVGLSGVVSLGMARSWVMRGHWTQRLA
jgi:Na+-driven multidrug efflux pump